MPTDSQTNVGAGQDVAGSCVSTRDEPVVLTVLARFEHLAAAHAAASQLEAQAVPSQVRTVASSTGDGPDAGELLVAAEHLARAGEILANTPARPNLVGRISAPLAFEAIVCPECGSTSVKRSWPLLRLLIGAAVLAPLMLLRTEGRMLYMILVTIWIPCCLVNPAWRCVKCGKMWKFAGLTARAPLAQQAHPAGQDKSQ